jgi:2-aminoadipate transaminase
MIDFSSKYSKNAKNMKKSEIRELLKLTQKPDMISFAGGLPDPETFPVEDLKEAADNVFAKYADKALQYGTTEGDNDLKTQIIHYESRNGIRIEPDNLLITSASQQALDMIPKLFLDPGDWAIAGRPTYIGAIQAIQSYRGNILGIPFSLEKDGFDMFELEKRYRRAVDSGAKVKYIYVIPDFQNPTGICWSLGKRMALLDFAYRENLPVVEDSPYREIRFLGDHIPSLYQIDQENKDRGIVIGLKTFSKILAPGLRMGWILGNEKVISKLVVAKQAMDLCSNVFTQKLLAEYMAKGVLDAVISHTRDVYRAKRNYMIEMLEKYMPKRSDLTWTEPEGGLFLWITLPSYINTDSMLAAAIERKVAYVIGSSFYFDDPEHNSMRINFSYSSLEQIEKGVKRLAEVISAEIDRHDSGSRGQSSMGC